MNPRTLFVFAILIAIAGAGWWVYLRPSGPDGSRVEGKETADAGAGRPMVKVTLPASLNAVAQDGKILFERSCAECHGENAAGSGKGPPLIHKIYEPNHHGDQAFQLAARNGVRAHHWKFGNMPARPEVTEPEILAIIAYVRELQKANGIN